jgi:hypothetical protein
MSYSNESSSVPGAQKSSASKTTTIYVVLISLLLATLALLFMIWNDKTKKDKENTSLQTQLSASDSSRNLLKSEYDAAIQRLDDLSLMNKSMDSLVRERNSEIQTMKVKIQKLLTSGNRSASDLAEAKRLISELNGKISGYVLEIDQLKGENIQLKNEKDVLIGEKETLQKNIQKTTEEKEAAEDQLDVASTLVATNISLVAIDERKSGKEVQRDKARRVDLLRLTLDVFNRVGGEGEKDLYIIITDPSGNVVSNAALGSGSFTTREDGDKLFSKKVSINFRAGSAVPITIDWKPESNLTKGQYKVEVYNNGFQIGSGTKTMK